MNFGQKKENALKRLTEVFVPRSLAFRSLAKPCVPEVLATTGSSRRAARPCMAQRAAERVFDRVFSSSQAGTEGRHSAKQEESSNQRNVGWQSEESLDLPDIVTSILKSWRKKDYFRLFGL